MVTRQNIVDTARTWLGVKWLHQGRTRRGIDCAGLAIIVGNELGLIKYETADYKRNPDHSRFLRYFQESGCIQKPVSSAAPGDILVMREEAYPCHCTIVTVKHQKLHIIHSHLPRKKVIEEELTNTWQQKIVACFSYPGVIE